MNIEAQNYQEGDFLDYTPAAAKVAGQVVQVAGLAGICATAIAANVKGAVQVTGVVQIRKKQEAFTAGDPVGWDEDGNPYGDTAGLGAATLITGDADFWLGTVTADAAATDKTCYVILNVGSKLYSTTITVSSAEILALFTTPKQLVAAPGAHRVIEFLGATILYDYLTAAYNTAANVMTIKYKDGSGAAASGTLSQTGSIDQTVDMTAKLIPVAVAASVVAAIENLALVLAIATANPTTGGGSLRVKITYLIHPTGF